MAVVDVIKFNGPSDVFAWKYPSEELGTWTQLIVNESQEAVLFKGGQALDVFSAGRHTLSTANVPLLNRLVNLPFGGKSPFAAEVWYINKLHVQDIKWGTPTPIQLQDPKYGIFAPVRAYGHFGIRIENASKFLIKLVGTLPLFDRENILKYFRGLYLTKAKDSISSYLVNKGVSILEINASLDALSGYIADRIRPIMADYGIELLNFYVNDINVPEADSAVAQLKSALAKRAEMNIIGYNYQQERSFDTLESAAQNPGTAATLMGAGLGLGMGVGMGGAVGSQFGGIAAHLNTNASSSVNSPCCGVAMPKGAKFCPACGGAVSVEKKSVKCTNCGAHIPKNVKYCPECGNVYNACPECGADIPDDAETCPLCGYACPKPCHSCGKPVDNRDARFCPHCGESLVRKCLDCGTDVADNTKFCPQCGSKI